MDCNGAMHGAHHRTHTQKAKPSPKKAKPSPKKVCNCGTVFLSDYVPTFVSSWYLCVLYCFGLLFGWCWLLLIGMAAFVAILFLGVGIFMAPFFFVVCGALHNIMQQQQQRNGA